LPRHPAALREAAARLDRAALAQGRGVTRALAAEVLATCRDDEPGLEAEATPHTGLFPG
jgi:hypothetical protein